MAIFLRLKSRVWRRRHVIVSAVALSLIVFLAVNALNEPLKRPKVTKAAVVAEVEDRLFVPLIRCVHLDLKGAPPKVAFLSSVSGCDWLKG